MVLRPILAYSLLPIGGPAFSQTGSGDSTPPTHFCSPKHFIFALAFINLLEGCS